MKALRVQNCRRAVDGTRSAAKAGHTFSVIAILVAMAVIPGLLQTALHFPAGVQAESMSAIDLTTRPMTEPMSGSMASRTSLSESASIHLNGLAHSSLSLAEGH